MTRSEMLVELIGVYIPGPDIPEPWINTERPTQEDLVEYRDKLKKELDEHTEWIKEMVRLYPVKINEFIILNGRLPQMGEQFL